MALTYECIHREYNEEYIQGEVMRRAKEPKISSPFAKIRLDTPHESSIEFDL